MPRASSQLRAFLIVSQFLIPYMVIVIRPSSHMPPCRWKGARIQHSAPQAVKEPERLGFAWAVGSPATLAALVLRSDEHTSELQSLMRISYAVFCLQNKHYITSLSSYIS